MAIKTQMSGKEIDRSLKAFNEAVADAEKEENDGLVLYIRDGKVAFNTYENLTDIVELEVVT